MKNTSKYYPLFFILFVLANFNLTFSQKSTSDSFYTLVVEAFDWGPGANKVVIPLNEAMVEAKTNDFEVSATREVAGVQMSPQEASGNRVVVHSYRSNENGVIKVDGEFRTLVLSVSPTDPLTSPMKYVFKDGQGRNQWVAYKLAIEHTPSKTVWNTEKKRVMPQVDAFDLNGVFSQGDITLTYANFKPSNRSSKSPLIIWLHGGGEGGTDTSIPLIANKATNYASKEIQAIFGGAHVLVPQSPTFWMQSANGEYTRGEVNDIYNETLMALIRNYVKENPAIDINRIYIGGCSNGGYMSLKLIIENPDYFAAAYISALAFQAQFVTEIQIERIKEVPIWFLHAKDDTVTMPDETVVPLYKRLIAANASNVHFSFYENVIDLSGMFGGADFRYNGHFSWIYSHSNHANFGFDNESVLWNGNPVNLMEWMAAQRN